ncbi:hypothetical protein D0865_03558 [Hortaea werneckii]|uniref:Phenylalanine ammonia-lyase n=1 Tax=Hortaea werneckii TaxID=91943 RepID=A0A3M7CWY5_HORWE|nr:hypothetical protein D0865_03558 [Hortaea werneckii]
MIAPTRLFSDLLLSQRRDTPSSAKESLIVDGQRLTIADVAAVSRESACVQLDSSTLRDIEACSKIIPDKIINEEVIYGVQQRLISHLTCGIISDGTHQLTSMKDGSSSLIYEDLKTLEGQLSLSNGQSDSTRNRTSGKQGHFARRSLLLNDPMAATCMPESWSRASMIIRLNSLAGAVSGVRTGIIRCLMDLLNKDVVPRIPIRGSISASGDLSALAWVASVMQGRTTSTAFCGPEDSRGLRSVKRADVALFEAGISPISLHAKEGLAVVNGTAVSAGVAALAAYESIQLAALSQLLTAMSVESLRGSDESFEPFIARVRPHPGQIDSAQNIRTFLSGSKLLNRHDSRDKATLRQDRYSLRTASQWIGPVLEDFTLAYNQLTTEINSVTDNPLIDAESSRVLHGGNFQARAVTSAVEKLRLGLQSIGRMLFTQCTEMMNPATSWGLPPNLCSDDPNDSFLFKGLDVVIAALTSELGFLANPVGLHVQTAEMGNQGLNSLALVSAHYTLEAVDVLSQIASAHLLALFQALDLRVIEIEGRKAHPPDAMPYIGQASRRMYHHVRMTLGIPFLDEAELASGNTESPEGSTPSMGFFNTKIYEAIRSGRLYDVVLESFEDAKKH